MKKLICIRKSSILLILIHFFQCTGMDQPAQTQPAIWAKVEPYFLRYDKQLINKRVTTLLDSAQNRVLMAMYWFTFKPIADKLIELKKKNIDVQIIIDESGLKFSKAIFDLLLKNNITPLIFPSESCIKGIMHQKFTVLDNTTVITGSANTTGSTLNPESEFLNNETVMVMHSKKLNAKFAYEFGQIERDNYHYYIDLAANNAPEDLPEWLIKLKAKLSKSSIFRRQAHIFMNRNTTNLEQKSSIQKFFGIKERIKKTARIKRKNSDSDELIVASTSSNNQTLPTPQRTRKKLSRKPRNRPLPKSFALSLKNKK